VNVRQLSLSSTAGHWADTGPRLLAATGDPRNREVMSGLPYHFWRYGTDAGVIDGVATADLGGGEAVRRAAWNATQLALGRGLGGHQFTDARNQRLWPAPPPSGSTVINVFQLFPRPVIRDDSVRKVFFIDQTLTQLFDHYGDHHRPISARAMRRAIEWEWEGYQSADLVIVNSEWARMSVIADYGVRVGSTAVVPQAANFDPDVYAQWIERVQHEPAPRADDALRLVFVGVDPIRKGLDRLLRAMAAVNGRGRRITLDVIGVSSSSVPRELAATRHVHWHGFVSKEHREQLLMELIGRADIGCLLSRAEAGGNCIREFHSLGLAVLGTTVGGSPDQALQGASWLVSPDESDGAIADRLEWLCRDRDEVEAKKAYAWAHRDEVLWHRAIERIREPVDALAA